MFFCWVVVLEGGAGSKKVDFFLGFLVGFGDVFYLLL